MKEVYFDGLVGPTHHYAGLAFGNIASMKHAHCVSNPKKAALQGLAKMKRIADLGISQFVLPPQERPSLHHLRALGFHGSDEDILMEAAKKTPHILQAACSSSAMWRANSATATPSLETHDGKVHLTIANLRSTFHRSLEAEETERLFRLIFKDFCIHPPLLFADEGGANHLRFSNGVHLFVYGREEFFHQEHRFPARQTREASEAIARRHGIKKAVFAKQNPLLIEKGVFHNDVICCGSGDFLLYHKEAFTNTEDILNQLGEIEKIRVEISIEEAVSTYLFNSQLLTLPNGSKQLLAPTECMELKLDFLPFPIEFIEIRESMQNGGGPACLRLVIPLTNEEISSVHPSIFLNEALYLKLTSWIHEFYRDRLSIGDLADHALLNESREALDSLTKILHLGSFYRFQN